MNTIHYPYTEILYGKYMEAIVFVHSCDKAQQFGLTEWSNSTLLTVTAAVLLNCTWTSKQDRALVFNSCFINNCIYSLMLLSTRWPVGGNFTMKFETVQ